MIVLQKNLKGLKGANVALCGMQFINLKKENLKILGIHFSYKKTLEQDQKFESHIVKTENVSKLWKVKDLSIEGKTAILKT